LDAEFNRVWPYIKPAIEKSKGRFSRETVKHDLDCGNYQLWPLPHSAVVTEIITYPTGLKVLSFAFIGGKYQEIRDSLPAICEWARGLDCTQSEGITNPAWRRQGNVEILGTFMVKDL
jgi:hypothetical protein